MKKTIVYYLIFVSVALFFSCSKSIEDVKAPLEHKEFTASVENSSTKTALDNSLKVNWVKDDKIYIVGGDGKAIYKARTGESTSAVFEYVEGGSLTQGPYNAYYPHSIYDGSNLFLGSQLNYDQTHPFCFNPMYATGDNTNLQFCNLCGILKLTIDKKVCETVSKVSLSSDKFLSGGFEIVADGDKYYAKLNDNNTFKSICYDCQETVSLADNAANFYFYLPPSEYENFMFTVVDGDEYIQTMTVKHKGDTVGYDPQGKPKTEPRNISIERNKIYSISQIKAQGDDYRLRPQFVSCKSGATSIEIPIYVKNEGYVRGIDFTIEYPEGMLTTKVGKYYPITINKERFDTGDEATVTVYAKGGTAVSFTNGELDLLKPGGEGILLTIPVTLTDVADGGYLINLKDIKCYVTDEEGNNIKTVTISDVQCLVQVGGTK